MRETINDKDRSLEYQAKPSSGVMTGWGLCVRRNDNDEHRAATFPAHGEGGSRRPTEEVHGLPCTPYLARVPSPLKKVPALQD